MLSRPSGSAAVSTNRQRSAATSPWRTPAIALSAYCTRRAGGMRSSLIKRSTSQTAYVASDRQPGSLSRFLGSSPRFNFTGFDSTSSSTSADANMPCRLP